MNNPMHLILPRICCPDHAVIRENERAVRLASTTSVSTGLQLDRRQDRSAERLEELFEHGQTRAAQH